MKFFLNLALGANAFFLSRCKWPQRNRPAVAELEKVGFFEGTVIEGLLFEEADWGFDPMDYSQGPSMKGRIDSIAEMNQFLRAAYNVGDGDYGATSINPAKVHQGGSVTDIYLVMIAGTEPFGMPWDVSNNAIANLEIFFIPESASSMRKNAKYAILNEIPRGAKVIIGGHSQGGMIAQQLAVDPDVKDRFQIQRVLTFGSPHTPVKEPMEGDLIMFQSEYDPVPYLDEIFTDNLYDACSFFFPWWCPPKYWIEPTTHTITDKKNPDNTNFRTPLHAHNAEYLQEKNAKLAVFDAVGDANGGAYITFNTGKRVFWTAPADTCAED